MPSCFAPDRLQENRTPLPAPGSVKPVLDSHSSATFFRLARVLHGPRLAQFNFLPGQ